MSVGFDSVGFPRAIERFYEAAIRPELWNATLDDLSDATGAYGALLLQHGPAGATLRAQSSRMGTIVEAFFREGWNVGNSREMRARALGVNVDSVITERQLYAPGELDRDRWQTDFLDRYGLKWFVSFNLFGLWEAAPLMLTLERRAVDPPFSEDECDQIRAALPHIRRAARIGAAVSDSWQDGVLSGLSARNLAGCLLDEAGRVLRVNEIAETIFEGGLRIAGDRLIAFDPESDAALQRLVDNVCSPEPLHPAVDAVAIMRSESGPLIVQAAPLVHTARNVLQRARALAIVNRAPEPSAPAEAVLTQVYNLTPGEARVAKALLRHGGTPAAARELGISVNTARTHLKSVFAKTGVGSQAQLAVMLSRIASVAAE